MEMEASHHLFHSSSCLHLSCQKTLPVRNNFYISVCCIYCIFEIDFSKLCVLFVYIHQTNTCKKAGVWKYSIVSESVCVALALSG